MGAEEGVPPEQPYLTTLRRWLSEHQRSALEASVLEACHDAGRDEALFVEELQGLESTPEVSSFFETLPVVVVVNGGEGRGWVHMQRWAGGRGGPTRKRLPTRGRAGGLAPGRIPAQAHCDADQLARGGLVCQRCPTPVAIPLFVPGAESREARGSSGVPRGDRAPRPRPSARAAGHAVLQRARRGQLRSCGARAANREAEPRRVHQCVVLGGY